MSKKRTKVGNFVHTTWGNLNIRCSNGKYRHKATIEKCKSYDKVELLMTRDEFKSYCLEHRYLIESLGRPSIDRINKDLGYTLDNIQIIELAENIRKDKTVFSNGFGVCFRCKTHLPEGDFCEDKRRFNGRTSVCKSCEAARGRLRWLTETGKWFDEHDHKKLDSTGV